VSIGGGEPTFQPEFTYALLKKCQNYGIHTAIDTCGYTSSDIGLKILREADLLLFDLKGMDPQQHKKNTGVSNEIILRNLEDLDARGKPIIIRVPLIPGRTDTQENVEATAKFLSGLKAVERVDLLAYHKYGTVKYGQLGRKYGLDDCETQSQERLDEIKAVFDGYGLNTQLGG